MTITTFASGSSGNCILVSMDGTHLLIDAGISYRRICTQLALSGLTSANLTAILITHEHSDHVAGLNTLVKRCSVPVWAPPTVARRLLWAVPGIEGQLQVVQPGEELAAGTLTVRAFRTPHDTPESVGWRISGSRTFALSTDMGCVTQEILDGLSGADVVLIEANHDVERLREGPYPYHLKKRILSDRGHLSNDDCAALAVLLAERGSKYILLGHLSRENNTPALAFQTVAAALTGRDEARLFVAPAAERMTVIVGQEEACTPSV